MTDGKIKKIACALTSEAHDACGFTITSKDLQIKLKKETTRLFKIFPYTHYIAEIKDNAAQSELFYNTIRDNIKQIISTNGLTS